VGIKHPRRQQENYHLQWSASKTEMGDENMEDAFREQVERKRREADAGDADAQNELGDFYYSGGPGIDKDYAESIKWYTKSALQGNVEAMYSLGWAYYSGEGATVNMLRAKDWFERAAAQQHKKACRNLGNILYGGVGGVAKDPSRAIALWEQASELGDAQAASLIGKLYTDGDKDTARDPEKGCRYLQVAADLGDGYAMFLLGCAYRAGNGVPCDAAAAKTWFDRAQDEAGIVDVELLFERGMEHYSGVGAEYSLSEAVKCFAAAAEGGHAIAMTFLCRLFFEGLARPGKGGGGAQDSVEGYEGPHYKISHEWGVKAYQKGETDVGYYLGLIHEMGHGPSGVDHQIAMHWYLTCIQNTLSGNHMYRIKSMVALGRC
jgi:TPR repeat protein